MLAGRGWGLGAEVPLFHLLLRMHAELPTCQAGCCSCVAVLGGFPCLWLGLLNAALEQHREVGGSPGQDQEPSPTPQGARAIPRCPLSSVQKGTGSWHQRLGRAPARAHRASLCSAHHQLCRPAQLPLPARLWGRQRWHWGYSPRWRQHFVLFLGLSFKRSPARWSFYLQRGKGRAAQMGAGP